MGSSDVDTPAKAAKTPVSQEQPPSTSTTTVYPDWTGFQAYSPIPPHGFFHSPVASSPQAHPYMWGPQHLMPPYGTPPPPYVAMYPHGGLYAHPSIPQGSHPFNPYAMPSPNGNAEASGNVAGGIEADGKERSSLKRSKESLGSLNTLTGKNNELGKTSGASTNGIFSQSAESASEGSSEGSDDNSQNESQPKESCRQDSLDAEASQNCSAVGGPQNGLLRTPHTMLSQTMAIMPMAAAGGVAGPTTKLNIGMDYWSAPSASPVPALHGKDERELKRQRRKQSNRESARRSRLRKQAECEELAQRVEVLNQENSTLRSEVNCIRSEYEQLLSQNASLKERLGEIPGEHEDLSSGKDDGNDNQQAGETELEHGGH